MRQTARQYEQVIFFQDDAADGALTLYRERGATALATYLEQWWFPGEHETRSSSSAGRDDTVHEAGATRLIVNTRIGYVGLEIVGEPD